jgi:hypothetical protein
MQNRSLGLALAAVAVAVAAVLFVVLREDDEANDQTTKGTTVQQTTTSTEKTEKPEKPAEPDVPSIVVEGGQPVGGVQELSFAQGEEIRFVVESDTEDDVHLHGYDLDEPVGPRQPAIFELRASIPGVFELELHHAVTQIAEITVE